MKDVYVISRIKEIKILVPVVGNDLLDEGVVAVELPGLDTPLDTSLEV